MDHSQVLLFAFLIGVVAGLRALTAPAVTCWAAHLHWLNLDHSALSFMSSTAAVAIFTVLACVELITDQLPSTPARTPKLNRRLSSRNRRLGDADGGIGARTRRRRR